MKIISADITGSLIINNQDVTTTVESSSIWSGSIASRVTNLEQFSSSLDATFATDQQLNQATSSLSGSIALLSSSYLATSQSYDIVSSSFSQVSGSFVTVSSSYSAASGSFSTRVTTLEAASSSLNTASGSFSTRVTNNEATGSSLTTASGSFSTRVTTIESKYATTGSNTYTGPQYINEGSNAIGFTSTASLYTDGGLRVTKDAFVSGTLYLNNLTVFGTSSIQYVTSSQLNVGTNIITVNTDTPAIRFGGLSVYDSGSTGLTGSILWDSEDNQWIYSNPSGSTYDSAVFLVGPRNSGVIGNEPGITCNFLSKGNGLHHMTSSGIFEDGSRTCFYGSSIITSTGVGCFSGAVCASSVASTGTITGTTIYGSTAICGGTVSGTTGTFSSTVTGTTLYGSTAVCAPTVFGTTRVCSANLCATTTICGPAFIGGTVSGTTGTFSSCVAATQLYADSTTNSIIQSTISTNSNCCAIISARWSGGPGIRMYYHPNSAVSVIENTYQAEAGQVFGDILFRHNVGGTQTTRLRLQADGGIACFSGRVCASALSADGAAIRYVDFTNYSFQIGTDTSAGGWYVYQPAGYRFTVKDGGYVGIGTTSVNSKLTIYEGDIRLYKNHINGIAASWLANINFTDEVDRLGARITGERTAWDGAPMGLGFDTGGVGTVTRRLTITSAGISCFSNTVCFPVGVISSNNSTYTAPDNTNVPNLYIYNSNNASTSAHSLLTLRTNNTGGGNPFISFDINQVMGFSIGIDNADSDKFKLANSWASLGSNTRLAIDTSGIACFSNTVCAATLYSTGDVIAYSDQSVKTNIRPIQNTLNRITNSRGILYDRTDICEKDNIGFIAQELEQQFPELISTDSEGKKGVKYQNAVAVLFEAIKEQQCQIEYLKSKIG
jgi:hypothetical protein